LIVAAKKFVIIGVVAVGSLLGRIFRKKE